MIHLAYSDLVTAETDQILPEFCSFSVFTISQARESKVQIFGLNSSFHFPNSNFFEETMSFDYVPGPCPRGRANFNEDDDTVLCPYNKSHIILRTRFGNHLIKCK